MVKRVTIRSRIFSVLGGAAVVAILATACDSADPPASDVAPDDAPATTTQAPAAQDAVTDVAEIPADNPDEVPPTVPPVLTNASDMARMLQTVYPANLREDGVGGTVGLWVFVDETGEVGEAEVRESSGYAEFDEAALRLVASMEFSPAQDSEGNARAVWISQPIQFTTED
jgi:TonB family protein